MTVEVAEEQAALLRKGIGDIFVNLARRNQTLLDRQIEFIDQLEANEEDPDQLENLFKLDHLATRMRRNAESLLVLAGAEPPRRRARPVALADVVRVAIGEVEDFTRINLLSLDEATVGGNAAVDLAHLLSELMENATQFSPPDSHGRGRRPPDRRRRLHRSRVTDQRHRHERRAAGRGQRPAGLARRSSAWPSPARWASSWSAVWPAALRVGVRLTASPAGGVTAVVDAARRRPVERERAARSPAPVPTHDVATAAGRGPDPAGGRRGVDPGHRPAGSDAPATLSDAIPAGDDFETGPGLAGRVRPGAHGRRRRRQPLLLG